MPVGQLKIGRIALEHKPYLTNDLVVADVIALSIERHQTEVRLQEQTEVVETINRIGQLLPAELDQQKLVRR